MNDLHFKGASQIQIMSFGTQQAPRPSEMQNGQSQERLLRSNLAKQREIPQLCLKAHRWFVCVIIPAPFSDQRLNLVCLIGS